MMLPLIGLVLTIQFPESALWLQHQLAVIEPRAQN